MFNFYPWANPVRIKTFKTVFYKPVSYKNTCNTLKNIKKEVFDKHMVDDVIINCCFNDEIEVASFPRKCALFTHFCFSFGKGKMLIFIIGLTRTSKSGLVSISSYLACVFVRYTQSRCWDIWTKFKNVLMNSCRDEVIYCSKLSKSQHEQSCVDNSVS